jgi:hypothetical protein
MAGCASEHNNLKTSLWCLTTAKFSKMNLCNTVIQAVNRKGMESLTIIITV